jgi:hypothetical protein
MKRLHCTSGFVRQIEIARRPAPISEPSDNSGSYHTSPLFREASRNSVARQSWQTCRPACRVDTSISQQRRETSVGHLGGGRAPPLHPDR